MRAPKTVLVGNTTYSLEFERLEDEDWGKTHHKSAQIKIDDDLPLQVERETVLHEVLHAVAFQAGDVWPNGEDPHANQENLIRMWSGLLLGVLQANPELVRYLTGPMSVGSVFVSIKPDLAEFHRQMDKIVAATSTAEPEEVNGVPC